MYPKRCITLQLSIICHRKYILERYRYCFWNFMVCTSAAEDTLI